MGYRIFYSYQSDIDEELNDGFIQDVLDNIKQELKGQYEIEIDRGMRGTPGNPPLAAEMFKKADTCDIFIGDVTFTSSRKKYLSKQLIALKKRNKELVWRDLKKEEKMSPNPNVLLETGHSWAKRTHYRTILIMNTAFGTPDVLPVDMGDIRWPVPYHLDSEERKDKSKTKKIRKGLREDLRNAILRVIESDTEYQRELFSPLSLHKFWNVPRFSNPYLLTPNLIKLIIKLREALSKPGAVIRLVGPSGSGRTRLIHELFKAQKGKLEEDINIYKLLYYNLELTRIDSGILKIINTIVRIDQHKILVIDNCTPHQHNRILEDVSTSQISLLTIGKESGSVRNSIIIEIPPDLTTELTKEILSETFSDKIDHNQLQELQLIVNKDLSKASAYINSTIKRGDIIPIEGEDQWKQLLGSELLKEGALTVLELISLFKLVRVSGSDRTEVEILATQILRIDLDSFLNIIDSLIERSFLNKKGDFVWIAVFESELIKQWWEKHSSEDVKLLIRKIIGSSLLSPFCEKIVEVKELENAKDIIREIIDPDGLGSTLEFINTREGSEIYKHLAEITPEEVLSSLSNVLTSSNVDLKSFVKGRRNIIYTLEKLAFRAETAKEAITLLYKLALAENEGWGNNATGVFTRLFQIRLASTQLSLDERWKLLKELFEDEGNT
ncbi:MAG: hypothetical protein AAF587_35100 [Bacteroidota bacterium]